jgi:hypothetical protein
MKKMFKLVNTSTKPLTPELAEQFRNMKASPTEREIDPKRVQHLREKVLKGWSITYLWSTAKLGNEIYRMNGNHSSNMLCGLNGQFPKGLKVHLDEYEVDAKDDLADLFRQFDDRKSGRTPSDVSGAYQGLFERLHDVPRKTAKLGVEGISWYRRNVEGLEARVGDDQYQLFSNEAYDGFLHWLGKLFTIKTPELKRHTIVGAMYGTYIANESAAKAFWEQVARGGVEYEENAPETQLDGWLKKAAEEGNVQNLKPGNYFQACIYAWNAHRDSKSLTSIKYDTKKGMLNISE